MTGNDIKESHLRHAALAQLYRWFQFYENPNVGITNQLDILAPDILVKSDLGDALGHVSYIERISRLPKEWRNAHFLSDPLVTIEPDGWIHVVADVRYLNHGMLPGGAVKEVCLTYTTERSCSANYLPKITSIASSQKEERLAAKFEDSYIENRMKSLIHCWFAIYEDFSKDSDSVLEIVTEDFELKLFGGTLDSAEKLQEWMEVWPRLLEAHSHVVTDFSFVELGSGEYHVSIEFEWEGIGKRNGTHQVGRYRYAIIATDNPNERFARIKTLHMITLEPNMPKRT